MPKSPIPFRKRLSAGELCSHPLASLSHGHLHRRWHRHGIAFAVGTAAFAVEGDLAVSGTVGISLEGSSLVAVGTGIASRLGPADAETFLEVNGAAFGLVATGTETAFELSQGAF